jgi:hypothetical protein
MTRGWLHALLALVEHVKVELASVLVVVVGLHAVLELIVLVHAHGRRRAARRCREEIKREQ